MVPADELNQDLGCIETVIAGLMSWFVDPVTYIAGIKL
jgi:hypothetical protein